MNRLYISTDLVKAVGARYGKTVPPKGAPTDAPAVPKAPAPGAGQEVDYVQSDKPPPGNLGRTEGGYWRVPKGAVSPKSGKVEDEKVKREAAKEEMSKDPLKTDEDPPKEADVEGAAKIQEQATQPDVDPLKEGAPEGEDGPAQMQAMITRDMRQQLADLGHDKDAVGRMTPQEAADHIASGKTVGKEPGGGAPTIAEPDKPFPGKEPLTLKDPQATFATMDPEAHASTDPMGHYVHAGIAEKLGDKKLAHFHREQARSKVGAEEEDPNRRGIYHHELATKLQAAGMHEEAAHHRDAAARAVEARVAAEAATQKDASKVTDVEGIASKRQAEKMRQEAELGVADTMLKPPAEGAPKAAEAKAEPPSGAEPPAPKGSATTTQQDKGQTQPGVDTLRQQQMAAQKRAIEEFHEAGQKHEKASADYKKKVSEYEAKLKEHADARKEHAADLKKVSQKLKDVRDNKPVKDDSELNKLKKKMKAVRMEAARHKDELSPQHEKHAKAIEKVKQSIASHQKKLSAAEKKLKAHQKKKLVRGEMSKDAFETASKNHHAAGVKLQDKYDKLKQKGADLSAQHKVIKQASDSYKADHKKQQVTYREKLRKMQEKHDKLKETIGAKHAKAVEAHKKKLKTAQAAVDKHKAKKDKLPEKPKKVSGKPPEAPAGKPKSDEEKMAHSEHQASARKMRENIESHLRDNPDLDPAAKSKLMKLHEMAARHEHIQNVPTSDQKKEMRDLSSRAKEHGADRHHSEVKAEQDAKAAKEQEKADKQKAREDKEFARKRADAEKRVQAEHANTPRPPENEFEQAEVLQHAGAAETALENIQSHLDDGDLDDETRANLEEMVSKLEEHSKLDTVPTEDQKAELKKIQSLTKQHGSKHFHDTAEGKQAVAGAAPIKKESAPSRVATTGRRGTGLSSIYRRASAFGSKMGAAAASPYGGAGSFADTLDYAGQGAATGGHYLLNSGKKKPTSKPVGKPAGDTKVSPSEEKDMARLSSKRAKAKDQSKTQKSINSNPSLWVRK